LACFLPALDFGSRSEDSFDILSGQDIGLVLLLIGWVDGNAAIPWSANVVLLGAAVCLCLRCYASAATLAGLATLLGLATWLDRHIPGRPLVGAYLWLGSMIVLAVGAEWARRRNRPDPRTHVRESGEGPGAGTSSAA